MNPSLEPWDDNFLWLNPPKNHNNRRDIKSHKRTCLRQTLFLKEVKMNIKQGVREGKTGERPEEDDIEILKETETKLLD